MSAYFEARYAGKCHGCSNRFDVADLITIVNGFTYGECCEEDDKEGSNDNTESIQPLRAGETICESCRLVRPCFC